MEGAVEAMSERLVRIMCPVHQRAGVGAVWYPADEIEDVTTEDIHGGPTDCDRELWVVDHEGYHSLIIGECSLQDVIELENVLQHLVSDGYEVDAYEGYCSSVGDVPSEWSSLDHFTEAYQGQFDSRRDFAQDLAYGLGAIREVEWPYTYIDWDRATDDLFMDYFSAPASNGGIYVYRSL